MADKQSLFYLPALKYFTYLFYLPALCSFPGYTIVVTIGNEPRSKLPECTCVGYLSLCSISKLYFFYLMTFLDGF